MNITNMTSAKRKVIMENYTSILGKVLNLDGTFHVKELEPGEKDLAYTILDGKADTDIFINIFHKLVSGDKVLLGVLTHEALHKKYTHPEYETTLINRTPGIKSTQIFHDINNILEDFTIETRALRSLRFNKRQIEYIKDKYSYDLSGKEPLTMLNTAIFMIWKAQPPVSEKDSPLQQVFDAMIAFTDMGPLPFGSHMCDEARNAYEKIAPILYEAVWKAPNERVKAAYAVYKILEPLIPDGQKGTSGVSKSRGIGQTQGENRQSEVGNGNMSDDEIKEIESTNKGVQRKKKMVQTMKQNSAKNQSSSENDKDDQNSKDGDSSGKRSDQKGNSDSDKKNDPGKNGSDGDKVDEQPDENSGTDNKNPGDNSDSKSDDKDASDNSEDTNQKDRCDSSPDGQPDTGDESDGPEQDEEYPEEDAEDDSSEKDPHSEETEDGKSESDTGEGNEAEDENDSEDETSENGDKGDANGSNDDDGKDNDNSGDIGDTSRNVGDDFVEDMKELETEITNEDIDLTDLASTDVATALKPSDKTSQHNGHDTETHEEYSDPELERRAYQKQKIKCENYFVTDASQTTIDQYMKVVQENQHVINVIAKKLRDTIITEREKRELSSSGRLNVRRYARKWETTPSLFTKRSGRDKQDSRVLICADCSGSMSENNKLDNEKVVLTILAEALAKADIPFKVITYEDNGTVTHHHYVCYKNGLVNRAPLMRIRAGSCNFDGFSIRYALKDLMSERVSNSLMIIISDGKPNPRATFVSDPKADTLAAVTEAKRKTKVIGIGIDSNLDVLKSIYKETFVVMNSTEALTKDLPRLIVKEVMKW